jgi:hypothetical protein
MKVFLVELNHMIPDGFYPLEPGETEPEVSFKILKGIDNKRLPSKLLMPAVSEHQATEKVMSELGCPWSAIKKVSVFHDFNR